MILAHQITNPILCSPCVPLVQAAGLQDSIGTGTDFFAGGLMESGRSAALCSSVARFSEPGTFSSQIPAAALLVGAVTAAGECTAFVSHFFGGGPLTPETLFAGPVFEAALAIWAIKTPVTAYYLFKRLRLERLIKRAQSEDAGRADCAIRELLRLAAQRPQDFGQRRVRRLAMRISEPWAEHVLETLAANGNKFAKNVVAS